MGKLNILKEYFTFLKLNKKWWLIPIVVILLLLGAVIFLSQSSAIAPFIYSMF